MLKNLWIEITIVSTLTFWHVTYPNSDEVENYMLFFCFNQGKKNIFIQLNFFKNIKIILTFNKKHFKNRLSNHKNQIKMVIITSSITSIQTNPTQKSQN